MRNTFSIFIAMSCLIAMLSQAQAANDRALRLKVQDAAVNEKRIALVIGNSDYTNVPLKNPVNDAKDVASKLRGLGFDVIERNNLKTKQIGSTLSEFRSKLSSGAVALVFYAGHGLQINGENFLPAVDADINAEEDVQNQSLSVRQIMEVLDKAKTRLNLVFLDACRNNPYASRSFRSADRGLARVSAPSGTLISYATKPGSVAADGNGRNGLYTSKLLAQMDSSLQIELTLKRIVSEVKSASQGKQEPWMEGSIEGDFCFGGCAGLGAPTANVATVSAQASTKTNEQIEDEYWEGIKSSNDLSSFEQYREDYPRGRYLNFANLKISQLKKQLIDPAIPLLASVPEKSADVISPETALWEEVIKSNKMDDYNAYLSQYPKGRFASLAMARVNKFEKESTLTLRHSKVARVRKERLVLMPLRVGEENKNLLDAMVGALVQGLEQNYEVFSGEQVAQKAREIFMKESHSGKGGCDEIRCMQGIAEAFQAELITAASVTRIEGGYFLALSIQNIFDNKVVYSNSIPCRSCDAFQVVEKLKELSGTSIQALR